MVTRPPQSTLQDSEVNRNTSASAIFEQLEETAAHLRSIEKESARQADLAALGLLWAGLAHEFNNLFTPLLGQTELAIDDSATPAYRAKVLERTHTAVRRCVSLSRAVLDAATPDEQAADCVGRVTAKSVLGPALEEALELADLELRTGHLEIHCSGRNIELPISETSLVHILVNLISNAVKAFGGRAGQVWIDATASDQGSSLLVTDDGPGVPEAIRETLFDPFKTTALSERDPKYTSQRSYGLGLAMCRRLTLASGGRITHDRLNERTVFSMAWSR